ncbi:hypothetical protein B0H10DRAFT_2436309 [Mycena sp. CBHHK59/15]|nr:hypothetical protein B0H10DRAFT_2436309 [Mycena sp. CBHHK59/15]
MAELAALLMRLPDTVLEQFCDASFTTNFRTKNAQLFSNTAWVDLDDLQAWLRQRGDLDHLLDPTISERNSPPVGLDPRSLYGMDGTFGDATFDLEYIRELWEWDSAKWDSLVNSACDAGRRSRQSAARIIDPLKPPHVKKVVFRYQ